jgi:hypothetical protein
MMKKQLLLLVLMMLPLMASAEVVEIDGICYNLISKGNIAEVTGNPNRYSGDVVIPETVTYNDVNYNVTAIKEKAFANCALNSISIPNSITKIYPEAFSNGSVSSVKIKDLAAWCNISIESYFKTNPLTIASHLFVNDEEIHDLVIPDGVKTIGNWQFYQFSGLTSVKIPSSVTSVGRECFALCSSLKTVEIGDNTSQEAATVLGQRAFYHSDNIDSIFLGNNVAELGKEAFGYIKRVRNVVIPNSVKTMGTHVFCSCENLESVQLSENLKRIEWASFGSCYSLKSIVIPDGVEYLGESAFGYCTSLAEVKLPSNLKKIDWCVFENCTNLTSIEIPDLTHTIYIRAFDGCSKLKTLTLGKRVQTIQNGAFANCPLLEDVYCRANTPPTCNDSFYDSYIEYIKLHVPAESVDAYKAADPWKNFKSIEALDDPVPEIQKCEKPTISYENGKLIYHCETEGATCQSTITNADINSYSGNEVQLAVTYNISVYATKAGYDNSDVATATLYWIDATPQTEGISEGIAQIVARPVLVKADNGFITVEGVDNRTNVSIYTTDGKQAGAAISQNNVATIATSIQPGSIAIVKVGEKSVKVVMK